MSTWPSATVAELQAQGVLLVEDGNHGEYRPRPDEFVVDGTSFIRAADIADGRVLFDEAGGINDTALARIRKGVGQAGDVIFSHKGTVGKLARVESDAPPFVCSPQTTFWRVLDESRLSRDYLYAFMRSKTFIDQWWMRKGETDMADYVSLTAQRQLRVVVPPVGVQQRIARPLTALDDLIDNCRGRIELLEQMAQAIYREWFVRFRFPGHDNISLVDSPLGPVPEGWSAARLGDLAAVNRTSRTPGIGERVKYLDISCLGDGLIEVPPEIDGAHAPGRARRVVTAGDVVWSMVRPNRRAHALLVEPGDDWIASTGLAVLTPLTVPASFLFEAVSAREFSDYLVSKEGGSAYPAVRPKDFEDAVMVVPSPDILQQFDEVTAAHHQLIWNLRQQSDRLAAMRDLLLPKLVTGQLDVSELDLDAAVGSVA
jgi:type I restriction enzyme S subunit